MNQAVIESATPMMRQWHQCKEKAKDSLLLFRMGDFYEAFYQDAEELARALNLTLTQRQNIPMAGVPFHALPNYLDRLIAKGLKVAIAEQTEDPKKAKGLVKRELTRVVTPGTLLDSNLLNGHSYNYCACIAQLGSMYGLSLIDVSTGDFLVAEYSSLEPLTQEIYRLKPKEILLNTKFQETYAKELDQIKSFLGLTFTHLEKWKYDAPSAHESLMKQFHVQSLDGFGLRGKTAAITCAGALLTYLTDELCLPVDHLKRIRLLQDQNFLILDPITLRHLEITEAQNSNSTTLFSLVDKTQTPMGARLLKDWIQKPSTELPTIHARQDVIEECVKSIQSLHSLRTTLSQIRDLERLMMRIHTQYANAKDFIALKQSLKQIPFLKEQLEHLNTPLLVKLKTQLDSFESIILEMEKALVEDPPLKLGEGKTFKKGYDEKLDEWLSFDGSAKEWIANYQYQMREETQIKTLKVGYNRVFGYYIEISKGQAHLAPASFQRRQTLANNERFITDALKSYESKVFQAEEQIALIERELFESLRLKLCESGEPILKVSKAIAHLDALFSLAFMSYQNHYVKPIVDESSVLHLNQGAHPLLDTLGNFIPNDTFLDDEQNRLALITGPNMAGKSTYIRQVALLVLMAQIGSFLPVQSAHIGVVDRIFTRIGASDDLSRGQSTFMVEMVETANILNHATHRSLVILDEIGRGTSTYDGIAIAQATALYLLRIKAKTLFATHYSELTDLEAKQKGVVNYTVAVHESQEGIQFLYKIQKGSTDKSYGIHVAQLAGLPLALIQEAKLILKNLEQKKGMSPKSSSKQTQLTFFEKKESSSVIEEEIKQLKINEITPIQALTKLIHFQEQLL